MSSLAHIISLTGKGLDQTQSLGSYTSRASIKHVNGMDYNAGWNGRWNCQKKDKNIFSHPALISCFYLLCFGYRSTKHHVLSSFHIISFLISCALFLKHKTTKWNFKVIQYADYNFISRTGQWCLPKNYTYIWMTNTAKWFFKVVKKSMFTRKNYFSLPKIVCYIQCVICHLPFY